MESINENKVAAVQAPTTVDSEYLNYIKETVARKMGR
jgi:hypothetical protein